MIRRYPCPVLPAPGERVVLPPGASRHVLVVCLHPRGDRLRLFDGRGGEVEAVLVGVDGGRAVVEGLGPVPDASHAPPRVVLLQGLLKAAAFEDLLRAATELGVSEIRPLVTRRAVVREGRPDRWARILEAAARQSGRPTLPEISPPLPLAAALAAPLPAARLVLLPGASPPDPPSGERALLVGPEGGLDPTEVEAALEAGFRPAGLGPWTLRADTAGLAALARYGWP